MPHQCLVLAWFLEVCPLLGVEEVEEAFDELHVLEALYEEEDLLELELELQLPKADWQPVPQ